MTWSDFYLLCFLVGFFMSVLSFLAGAVHLHLPFKMHLPFHGGHGGGAIGHGGYVGHAPHAGSVGGKAIAGTGKIGSEISWFNASSILAFLAWFGGMGYILTTHSRLVGGLILLFATVAGLSAGWVVYRFMLRLLRSGSGEMNEWDYRHEGTVAKVSITIPADGTGEVIFEQHGVRKSSGARGEDGEEIERGSEVVISRYEKGIAYVKKWEEFIGGKV